MWRALGKLGWGAVVDTKMSKSQAYDKIIVLLQLLCCVGVQWEDKTLKSWGGFPGDGLEAWVRERATRQRDPPPSKVSPFRCAGGRAELTLGMPETINLLWKPCKEGWSALDAVQKKQQVSHSSVQQTLSECLLHISVPDTRDTALKIPVLLVLTWSLHISFLHSLESPPRLPSDLLPELWLCLGPLKNRHCISDFPKCSTGWYAAEEKWPPSGYHQRDSSAREDGVYSS